jgi:hypothetical protein
MMACMRNRAAAVKDGASTAAVWLALAGLSAGVGLSACTSTRVAPASPSTAAEALPPPPPTVPAEPPPAPPPAPESAPTPAPPPPAPESAPTPAPPAIANSTLPPCVPAKSKPHRKHKTRQEPPQGPEPPSTASQPQQGAIIDAQVGQLGAALTSILGKDVRGPQGEDLGRVVDVLADADGHVRAAIIDFGGFLGVGTRRIAIDWPLLRFDPKAGDKSLVLSVTREKLQSVPEYKDPKSPRVLMPPAAAPLDAADTRETKK